MKELESGYIYDPYIGATYHFEHIPVAVADEMIAPKEFPYIVEAVNHTLTNIYACVHLNKYYATDFRDALCIATRIEIYSGEIAEEVINIRPVTEKEAKCF